ncbi:hypothetical protein [Winogradskyella sp. A2]|uniref:hypothetical protein n=1 Tax=Winogradskyella sp. A2 TaxID=3366944 RepID=UPI00398C7462
MKPIKIIILLTVISLVWSCSKDDDGGNNNSDILNNYETQCNDGVTTISGPKAAYWDSAKGIPLPLTQVPLLDNIDGQFIHPQYPALGFPMPQGYNSAPIFNQNSGTIGVDVKRNDNGAIWTYIPTTSFTGNFTITDAVTIAVNKMFADMGYNGNDFEVECSATIPVNLGGNVSRIYSARLINFGNFTGQTYAILTTVQGLGGITYVSIATSAGLANEYNSLVRDIFLPLNFQLLVNDGGELDSDLDGTPDIDDPEPHNPNVF